MPMASSLGCLLAATLAAPAPARDTSWLRAAKVGVFLNFVPTGNDFQKRVDEFDVNDFADQMAEVRAGYVILTLGVNSGYYCAPNATYERLAGLPRASHTARRDLPRDLAKALSKRKIRLMLYLPARAPQDNPTAMKGLSDVNERSPAPQEFTRKWSAVIAEWSNRYGTAVSGWWFDGCYATAGWDDRNQRYGWRSWAAACRVGNPKSLLAFNPGADPKVAFKRLTAEQDFTAGEQNQWVATPSANPAPAGVQWHALSYLGSTWGSLDAPRLSNGEIAAYARRVTGEGGALTFSVGVSWKGRVQAEQLVQLRAIRDAVFR